MKDVFIVFLCAFLIIFSSCHKKQPYRFSSQSEYESYVKKNYELGDSFFDSGKYKKAIRYYHEVINAFEYNSNDVIMLSPEENINEAVKKYEKFYFATYNIACAYSLINDSHNAKFYLLRAINSGYPYLEHLLQDADLLFLFESAQITEQNSIDFFNMGCDPTILKNKSVKNGRGPNRASHYNFLEDGQTVVMRDFSVEGKGNYVLSGIYTIQNYFIIADFFTESYLQTSGYISGIGIPEEDCKKIENKVNIRHIIPMFSIGNARAYFEWPFLIFDPE